MENVFSIITFFEESEGIEQGDKAIYVTYKSRIICYQLFKEINDIRGLLQEIHTKLLRETPDLKIEGKLNFLYFNWLEVDSRLKEELYGKRAS